MAGIEFDGFLIAPAEQEMGPQLQGLIVSVLHEYGLEPDLGGVDADVLDIECHYRAPGGEFFAIYRDSVLVGTAGWLPISSECGELRKMYLLPAARGVGLGQRLLQLAESQARNGGYQSMQLETASTLKEAVKLYERNGYLSQCAAPHVSRCDRLYRKRLVD